MLQRKLHLGLGVTTAVISTLLASPALAGAAPPAQSQRPVCPGPVAAGSARCHAHVVTDAKGTPQAVSAPKGYGPAQFHGAYGLPAAASTAQTIAIVDAYDDPNTPATSLLQLELRPAAVHRARTAASGR